MAELIAGRYELVREIGKGASATVYRAYDKTLDRYIAIKLVSPALANDPDFVDRFLREARMAAGLQHPNIVTVHDVGESEDGRPFLAMALVEGVSLEQVIADSAPLPLSEATRICGEITAALEYLHAQGLVHRDVKPSNILVEETGRVVLSDFGIAYARESARYTNTGVLLGTPRYMAPEQFQGDAPTTATDVYALGVIAFELLSGAPPFEGTGTALMYRIVHEPPPSVTALAPEVPPGIEAAIARALAKDPEERWATPAEFFAALTDPDASATMLGVAASGYAAAAVAGATAAVEPAPVEVAGEPDPVAAAEEQAAVKMADEEPGPNVAAAPPVAAGTLAGTGAGGGRFGGRGRGMLGAFGAGVIGFGLAGYCMASGGILPASDDDEPTPTTIAVESETPSATADRTASPTRTPTADTDGTAVATATTGSQGTVTASSTATPAPAATNTPRPGNTPAPTATKPPAPTATKTAAPTATKTKVPTATASPTPTATRTNTPTPTHTPPPTATPTPTMAPPNPPSNVNSNGNTLSWSDNSNNENGFNIYSRATNINTGEDFIEYYKSVGPNTTSTQAEPPPLPAIYSNFRWGVSAYNAAGESSIAWE